MILTKLQIAFLVVICCLIAFWAAMLAVVSTRAEQQSQDASSVTATYVGWVGKPDAKQDIYYFERGADRCYVAIGWSKGGISCIEKRTP